MKATILLGFALLCLPLATVPAAAQYMMPPGSHNFGYGQPYYGMTPAWPQPASQYAGPYGPGWVGEPMAAMGWGTLPPAQPYSVPVYPVDRYSLCHPWLPPALPWQEYQPRWAFQGGHAKPPMPPMPPYQQAAPYSGYTRPPCTGSPHDLHLPLPHVNVVPRTYMNHPYARSPRDFFMWNEVYEDTIARERRPALVP